MARLLDYIYSGSVSLLSHDLEDFINLACLLKIPLDYEYLDQKKDEFPKNEGPVHRSKEENVTQVVKEGRSSDFSDRITFSPDEIINYSRRKNEASSSVNNNNNKSLKKLPDLMPLSSINRRYKIRKGLYNQATPSPWCPRNVPLLASPREIDCLPNCSEIISLQPPPALLEHQYDKNDSNNNFTYATPSFVHPPGNSSIIKPIPILATPQTNCLHHHPPRYPLLSPPPPRLLSPPPPLQHSKEEDGKINLKPLNNPVKRSSTIEEVAFSSAPGETEQKTIEEENDSTNTNRNKEKPFRCQDCGKCFSQLRNFKYHRSIHEGTKEFAARCPECGKHFNDRGYLSSHLKIHRDRKEYACPHCPKRFNQRVAYNMHLRVHTGLKPHECPTCGKGFSRKMLLKQHQRVHTGERPYSCPECGKTFADRSNMSLHQRLHTGVKPYTCTLCPKSFTKKHHLKTHMNFHTGLKPYSCQNCGLAFSQSSNMRTHYKKCVLKPCQPQPGELPP
ncbi:zinc finger protein 835-like [Agrilus planipennis]|uniref:Zinc finger protein 835-like n=1 Tax=Agrilus planipennis TaxID=224129 RepID=A0A7F5R2G2_AGRPL|nr:zinc finger protein 835-like [Agrilus planipennis]